ncbi:MAG TPA: phosphoribosylanthranilate isomerase [Baekduia sp.]|nr:phosphoribosylanthranilate isomerase [Baekduia sp.]
MSDATRIKFCGITNMEDAQRAVELEPWAIGLIFWPQSPRACDPGVAQRIGATFRRDVEIAGVFVNSSMDEIAALAEVVPLSLIQLHGDEGPSFAIEAARRTGARVIKAKRVASTSDIQDMERFHTDFQLYDAYRKGVPGGTGETFDWELTSRRVIDVPLIVSGGLTPDNVGEAIAATRPFAVDVASGVEAAPGLKDPAKLRAFSEAVAATHTLVE